MATRQHKHPKVKLWTWDTSAPNIVDIREGTRAMVVVLSVALNSWEGETMEVGDKVRYVRNTHEVVPDHYEPRMGIEGSGGLHLVLGRCVC